MPIDDPVMEHLPNLSNPIVDTDLGTSQTQRRLTAHGNTMFSLTTMETAVFDRACLVRIPTNDLWGERMPAPRVMRRSHMAPVPLTSMAHGREDTSPLGPTSLVGYRPASILPYSQGMRHIFRTCFSTISATFLRHRAHAGNQVISRWSVLYLS